MKEEEEAESSETSVEIVGEKNGIEGDAGRRGVKGRKRSHLFREER